MFLQAIQKLKLPVVVLTMWTLVFGFFCMGVFHKTPMQMAKTDASTVTMSLPGESSCCGMTVSQHMDSWRIASLSIPRGSRDTLALLALGLIAIVAIGGIPFSRKFHDQEFLTYRLYLRQNPNLQTFHHLKLAFARGILNPKIY